MSKLLQKGFVLILEDKVCVCLLVKTRILEVVVVVVGVVPGWQVSTYKLVIGN